MTLEITGISQPNELGLVTVRGNYIPSGYTCPCKSVDFEHEIPQSNNLEYIKATIKYLIEKS